MVCETMDGRCYVAHVTAAQNSIAVRSRESQTRRARQKSWRGAPPASAPMKHRRHDMTADFLDFQRESETAPDTIVGTTARHTFMSSHFRSSWSAAAR